MTQQTALYDMVTTGWPEDLADALDLAVARFDPEWRLVTVNARWRQRYGVTTGNLETVSAAMVTDAATLSPEGGHGAAEALRDEIRLFARDAEVSLPDGSTVLLTASPLASGGAIVTSRDMQRDRLTEEATLRLLSEGLVSADVGMALWDAGLVVRVANKAWTRHATQTEVGDDIDGIDGILARLIGMGLGRADHRIAAEDDANSIIAKMHRTPRQWTLTRPDGHRTRLHTFPTKSGGVLATAYDATVRRDVEERAQELLSDAVNSMGVGILLMDEHLRVVLFNRSVSDLVFNGKPPANGTPITDVVAEALDNGNFKQPDGMSRTGLTALLIDAIVSSRDDIVMELKDGRWMGAVNFPTRMGGYVSVVRDVTERVIAERAAEEANVRTRTIVETLGEGVALYDADMRMQMNNPAFQRIVMNDLPLTKPGDLAADEMRACIREGTVPVGPEGAEAMIARFLEFMESSEVGIEFPLSGGRTAEISNYRTADGGYLVQLRDVTERVAAERAAEEANVRTRTIVETLGEGVALYDADMRMQMNNPAFRRIAMNDLPLSQVGATAADEIRACIREAAIPVEPDGEDAMVYMITSYIEAGVTGLELPLADGRIAEVSNYRTTNGGYLVHMRDVTERKNAELAAREADTLLRLTIEASPTPLLVSRRSDGRIFFKSAALRALLGDIDTTVDIFADPDTLAEFLKALERDGVVDNLSARLKRMAADPVETLISARRLMHGGDELIISSIRDMTEVLAIRSELELQRDAAHQAEKLSALGELLAGVAHELNNPLSIIVAHAMMLEDELVDSPSHVRARKIGAAAERSSRIVRSFLSMARRRPAKLEMTDINEVVAMAADISTYGIEKHGTQIQLELTEGMPPIAVDADQLIQVISNLVVNAGYSVRAMGVDGAIRISTARTAKGETSFEVVDNGPGIPADIRARVFEPFFTTKDVGSGTGIGLAFCHRVLTAHGGTIRVEDAPCGGARFVATLPIGPDVACEKPPVQRRCKAPGSVLVVDDEKDVCNAIVEMLRLEGFVARGAYSGAAALEICSTDRFDAVVSDVRMPIMDGWQFRNALREVAPEQASRLGFLTGDVLDAPTGRIPGHPRPLMLMKPINRSELAAFVTRLAEGA